LQALILKTDVAYTAMAEITLCAIYHHILIFLTYCISKTAYSESRYIMKELTQVCCGHWGLNPVPFIFETPKPVLYTVMPPAYRGPIAKVAPL
jgi:hypothetical protein